MKKIPKRNQSLPNYEQDDYLLFLFIFSIFLSMYYTHLDQFDIIKNKTFETGDRKLWKEQKKKRKIGYINNYNKYWKPIVEKRNKFID
jgi:hypothetical protein